MRKPVRIDTWLTEKLNKAMREYGIDMPKGYTLYVTDTVRGRCSKKNMNITVPTWAVELRAKDVSIHCNDKEYAIYYACHEIAHILAPPIPGAPVRRGQRRKPRDVHGAKFMEAFMSICPERLQYFEIGYKPRLAAAAGIKNK